MTAIHFTKMQGAGNDFVVLDAIDEPVRISTPLVRFLADRRFGIGADQLLLIEPAQKEGEPLRYRIFNSDGDEVEQCGNGARCVGRFALARGYAEGNAIPFVTMKGRICVRAEADGRMVADMGQPRFACEEIPFNPEGLASRTEGRITLYTLPCPAAGCDVEFSVASMGNPHATVFVENVDTTPIEVIGPFLQQSACFPESVNVGFVERLSATHARIRVWERGPGETLACGTGTSAAMAAGVMRGLFENRVEFDARGGDLACAWAGPGSSLDLIGPAEVVFTGTIEVPDELLG
ncbi:diaminopimelate epimerase [Sutterella sp.]|uniref:diaminopimelate epimerase n=1 Tax=Sutterella sp. TaxID=1981025 RepID=UPI0026E049B9|nr:diaminopimelate epimerase [Sutterella sp.]MDO5532126.1 diaminopimelate epimerase [Sutterella sp.]